MTTSSDPDEIRADIERTRADVSDDVNRLTDAAKPANVAHRQVDKVKEAATNLKDKVMGSASDAADSVSGTAGSASDAVQSAASSARQTASKAPRKVRSKTRGNPLAAGVIAFGAGLLVSSLIPSSQREQQAVSSLQDNLEPLKEETAGAVREVADRLREPAQDAVESVRATATDAVDDVKQQGASATEDVRGQVAESRETVQDARSN